MLLILGELLALAFQRGIWTIGFTNTAQRNVGEWVIIFCPNIYIYI